MKQSELPLYPKHTSIYNTILQLAIAIVFIVILTMLWVSNYQQDQTWVEQHFSDVGHQYLAQASAGVKVFLHEDNNKGLQQYINDLSGQDIINDIVFYDKSGQIVVSSKNLESVNDLYGISLNKINRSAELTAFIQEVRTDNLKGYLRITIEKNRVIQNLMAAKEEHQQLIRLVLSLAGFGFLLTLGLNRFNRRSGRLKQT